MNKKTWKKDTLSITYCNPSITADRMDLLTSMKDVMYFYYDINIMDKDKTLFSTRTHEFPKVQNLPIYIEHMLEMKEDDMFVYENFEDNGFHRKKLYNFIELNDSFNMDMEYFYKIERTITYVKQQEETELKKYEDFTLTIGKSEPNKDGYSNGEFFGRSVYIKYLTRDDLLNLKKTAEDFCKCAIDDYNNGLKKHKIKCPKCGEHQLYLDSLLPENNESYNEEFKCISCGHEFNDNDDCYID